MAVVGYGLGSTVGLRQFVLPNFDGVGRATGEEPRDPRPLQCQRQIIINKAIHISLSLFSLGLALFPTVALSFFFSIGAA